MSLPPCPHCGDASLMPFCDCPMSQDARSAPAILALPAPKTIKTKRNTRRRSKCHLNTPKCSISQKLNAHSHFTIQACEDDSEESYEQPMLDVDIAHCGATQYEGYKYPSQNFYMVRTDRWCTHQELVELTHALVKALDYLPEDGTPA